MKPKVLVAEDNVDHLELLTDALSEENEVVGTDSKEGCMEQLQKDTFDLVVLDYNLKKDFSGFDILREITLKYPYMPVIMVTAYGNEELAVKVMKIGAKDYIRKTLDNNYIDRIVSNVRILVNKREKEDYRKIKEDSIAFLHQHKERFLAKWKEKIHTYEERFDIKGTISIDENLFAVLFEAFLSDLESDRLTETLSVFRQMLFNHAEDERMLLDIELLNISFREISHDILLEQYPHVFDFGSELMEQLNWIVDANELVLSKEYEKIIDKSVDGVRKVEQLKGNLDLMIRLRKELADPFREIRENASFLSGSGCECAARARVISERLLEMESTLTKFLEECKENLQTYREGITTLSAGQ